MSGRRLLDLAKLINASRNVLKQHIELRSKQLDTYGKTSTLAKATKNQTDRVTLTLKAARTLAERLNEEVPKDSEAFTSQSSQNHKAPSTRDETILRRDENEKSRNGVSRQDQSPGKSEATDSGPSHSGAELEVKQNAASREVLPDGTVSLTGTFIGLPNTVNGGIAVSLGKRALKDVLEQERRIAKTIREVESDVSSRQATKPITYLPEEAIRLQRKAESQTPSVTAAASTPKSEDHDRDVYYEPSTDENTSYSSLPKAKIPKFAEQSQYQSLYSGTINSDVFHDRPEAEHIKPEMSDVPKDVDVNMFRSSKVSDMLGFRKSAMAKPRDLVYQGLETTGSSDIHPALKDSRNSSHFPVTNESEATPTSRVVEDSFADDSETELRNLAEDMAKDAESNSANVAQVSKSCSKLNRFTNLVTPGTYRLHLT